MRVKYQAAALVYGKLWRDHCAQSGAEWNVLLRPKIPPPEPRCGFQKERDAAKVQELYLKSDTCGI